MEYKYYRELKHNYLVAKNEKIDQSNKDSYQVRILKTGNLKGFVPCDVRIINNEYFLYYEINSLQSIQSRFGSRGMKAGDLIRLFGSLKKALEGISDYLLGIENVVLDAKSVFTDLNTGDFYFLYSPFKDNKSDFAGFIDELFDLVDHEDEKAVEMVYSCSEKAQVEGILVFDLIGQMLDMGDAPDEKEEVPMESSAAEMITEDECMDAEDYLSLNEADEDIVAAKKANKKERKMDSKAQILFSFLFFGLVAAMVFVRMNFILSKEENILSIIVMIVSMVTGLVAFLSGIKEMTSKSEHSVMEEAKSSENDFVDAEDYDTWQGDDTKDEQIDLNSYKSQISIGGKTRMAAPERASMGCGDETVVLDEGDEERAVTLYSRNADRTIRICLEKLPLTIGKLQGCVDSVIDDKSVSRIHCRFSQNEDGRIMLTDLNSTNGTFRNGLRLDPQKNTFIEEGDEVRIGRICFDCR